MSGSRISNRARSGSNFLNLAIPSLPVAAVSTVYPSSLNASDKDHLRIFSSSTTRIVLGITTLLFKTAGAPAG